MQEFASSGGENARAGEQLLTVVQPDNERRTAARDYLDLDNVRPQIDIVFAEFGLYALTETTQRPAEREQVDRSVSRSDRRDLRIRKDAGERAYAFNVAQETRAHRAGRRGVIVERSWAE